MMKFVRAAIVMAGALIPSFAANGQTVAEFYKDKQVRIVVGTGAGQEYDLWARLIGRHIGRHIPGNPTLFVENMPGGGHIRATNHLYNIAAKDGSVLGMVSRHVTDAAVLKVPAVRFEPTKFNWLGSPEINWRAFMVRSGAGVEQVEDLAKRPIIVGATGSGQGVTSAPTMLKNLLGLSLNVVEGYRTASDIWLAMERGEVDAVIQTVGNVGGSRRMPINEGKVKVLFTMEEGRVPGIDKPTVFEIAKTDEQKMILSFFAMATSLGRPLMAPPGVPEDRVAALRRAFDATMKDPAFISEATKSGYELQPQTGDQIAKRVEAAVNLPPSIIEKAQQMYSAKK